MSALSEPSPLVSIITPVYNGERFIRDAAASVLAQSYENWEWIVIDDGSMDETAAILEAMENPRISVLRQANRGVSSARNAGLEAARGKYVTFLDADDLLPEDALRLRVKFLENNQGIDIANGRVRVTRNSTLVRLYVPSASVGPLFPRLARLDPSVFFGVVYMVRHSSIRQFRFPDGLSNCEDLIFFLELSHYVDLTYGAVDGEVYEYRLGPDTAMTNLTGVEVGYLELIRRARRMAQFTLGMSLRLRFRIASILTKSWLREGRPIRAARAFAMAAVA